MAGTPGKPSRPRSRVLRWLVRLLALAGLVAGVVVAALLAAVVWLNSEAGLGTVAARGLAAANDTLLGEVRVGRTEGHLLTSFTLHDVTVEDPDGVQMVGAEALTVQWRPGALLRKDVVVDRVAIEGLRGDLASGPAGLNLLSILPRSEEEKEASGGMPVDLLLRHIEVDGEVVFDPGSGADPYRVRGLELVGALDWTGGRQAVEVQRLAGEAIHPAVGTFALDGDVVLDSGTIPELALNAEALGATLSAAGAVGSMSEPDLDLEVVLDNLDLRGLEPLAELPLAGSVSAEIHARGPLKALALEGTVDLPRGELGLDLTGDLLGKPMAYDGTLILAEVDLSSFLTAGPGVAGGPDHGLPGLITGRLEVQGEGTSTEDLRGQIQASFEDSELLGYRADSLTLGAAIEPPLAVTLQSLELASPLGSADLHGSARVRDERFSVAGHVHGVSLARVGALTGVADLGGVASVDLDASGGWGGASGFWIEGDGYLAASSVRAPSTTVEQVRVKFDAGYAAAGPSGRVAGEITRAVAGGVPLERTIVDVQLESSAVVGTVDVLFRERLTTKLEASFGWSGPHPVVQLSALDATTFDSTWTLAQPCTVTLLPDSAVRIDGLDLGGVDGRLRADGLVAPRGVSSFEATGEELRLAALQPLIGETAVAGVVDLDLSLEGIARQPSVNVQVRGDGVAVDQYGPFALELGVVAMGGMTTVVVKAGGEDIEPLQLQGLVPFTVALQGAGWNPDGYIQLFAEVPLQHTSNLDRVLPQVRSLPRSRFGLTLTVAGQGTNPEVRGRVRLRDVRAANLPTISADVTASLVDGDFSVGAQVQDVRDELLLAQLDGTFDLQRVLAEKLEGQPVDRTRPYLGDLAADVNLVGLPVETLRLYTDSLDALHGKLKGHVLVTGSARNPRVEADLSLRGGRVGTEALQKLTLAALVEKGALEADLQMKGREGGQLSVRVGSPIDISFARPRTTRERFGQPGLTGVIAGDELSVGLITGFLDGAYDPTGSLSVEGTVGGTLLEPLPEIRLGMNEGGVCMSSLEVCFEHAELRARATRASIIIDQLTATSRPSRDQSSRRKKDADSDAVSDGWLEASGSMELQGAKAISLDVRSSDFWVSCTRQIKLRTDVGLLVRGEYPDVRVRGGVTANMLKLELGDELRHKAWPMDRDQDLHVHRGAGEVDKEHATERGASLLDTLDLDVRLVLKRNCWLYMDMSAVEGVSALGSIRPDLQLEGDIGISLSGGVLSTRGEVSAVRGNLTVLGRQFKVDHGGVTFTGATPPDPQLDVTATYRSRYGDIAVLVEGRATAPTLQFTSEDLADEADILSVLLFGAPADQLRPGAGAEGGDDVAFVTNMITSKANQALSKVMGKGAVDMLNIEPGPSGPGSLGIEVGKALTDRVFLITRYRRGVPDDENKFEGQLEISISRRLYIELRYGDAGNGGVEVFFKWRL
jgi:hypothetical protein